MKKSDCAQQPAVTPPSATEQLPLPAIDFEARRTHCAMSKSRLLALLRSENRELHRVAEVIGREVWITFEGKQSAEVTSRLSQLGFGWNPKYRAWIHRCGWLDRRTMPHPRARHGSFFPADLFPA